MGTGEEEATKIMMSEAVAAARARRCPIGTQFVAVDAHRVDHNSLCYAVHGMDLQGIVFLDNTILPERLPCRFLFLARYPVCKMQAPFLQLFFNAKVEL